MADSSRAQLLISPEAVFAEVPSSPVMQSLRFLKESLTHKNTTVVSDEIRADRLRSDLLLVGVDTAGAIDGEFSPITYDSLIEAALGGTWDTTGDVVKADGVTNATTLLTSATAAFTSADVGKTITGAAADFVPGTFIASVTNGTNVVLSRAALSSGASKSFTIKARTGSGNVLQNGVTLRSFLIEKGLIQRTPSGRLLTSHAFRHLGLVEPTRDAAQFGLFNDDE